MESSSGNIASQAPHTASTRSYRVCDVMYRPCMLERVGDRVSYHEHRNWAHGVICLAGWELVQIVDAANRVIREYQIAAVHFHPSDTGRPTQVDGRDIRFDPVHYVAPVEKGERHSIVALAPHSAHVCVFPSRDPETGEIVREWSNNPGDWE